MGKLDLGAKLLRSIEKIAKEQKAAEKAGDIETALEKNKQLRSAIQAGVNDPSMPRAKPLSDQELAAYAERMAPQIEGKLTRKEKGAQTVAGKTQQQFEREKTLPVQRRVLPGKEDPSKRLPTMTMEDQKGGVLIGLSGDPTLARTELSGIGDVVFDEPVILEGGPRYRNKDKFWASNIAGASNLLGAAGRASQQYGGAPVYAMYQKMPEGFGFAQHYLESLLQYIRPDQLPKDVRLKLEDDIRKGFINAQGKRVTFPEFAGFDNPKVAALQALDNSVLRKHMADRLEKSKLYDLRPAADVQFAVTHPELTNLETGASGFTIAELPLNQPLTPSPHRTYTHDIHGTAIGQTHHPTPYDLVYRDELDLVRLNPKIADEPFNTLKLLGPRQKIDEQLVNELNEYQERLRRLLGYKEGGDVDEDKIPDLPPNPTEEDIIEFRRKSKEYDDRQYWKRRGPNSEDKNYSTESELNRRADYPMSFELPEELDAYKMPYVDIDSIEERQKSRYYADGGSVDAQQPDWYQQLGTMMQNPEPTWYDQLGEMMMKEGGGVKMADGGQSFPLQDLEEEKRRLAVEGTDMRVPQKYPTLVKIGEGVKGIHEFVSKPFGYENPPAEFLSELLGIPAVGQTLEDIGYGMPLTRGAGVMTTVRPEVAEAALTAVPVVGKAAQVGAKSVAKAGKALAPTVADLLETQLQRSGMMMPIAPEGKAAKVKAPANKIGFYNPAEKAALNLQRKRGSGDAFISDLKKQPGVNDERITELGLDQFRGNPNVTREEIIAATQERRIPLQESVKRERDEAAIEELERRHDELLDLHSEATVTGNARAREEYAREMADNLAEQKRLKSVEGAKFNPTDYPDYSMPGGTDYREIRVKLPENLVSKEEISQKMFGKSYKDLTDEERFKVTPEYKKSMGEDFTHTTHHGDERNVLFHLRVANHADQEGKKGLLIDELQSDWHQQGAKKGYGPKYEDRYRAYYDTPTGQVDIGFGKTQEEVDRMVKASGWEGMPVKIKTEKTTAKVGQGVPEAPFKDNWYQLGLKRAIKEAVDTGMDRVYLTTGKRQIDRYENALRANVDAIEYEPYKGDNGDLLFEISGVKNGQEVINKEGLTYKELEELVGKDMASKMKSNVGESLADERPMRPHWMRLSGDNLSIGGEGMKQWYDKTYKNYLEKYAKQHGSKLGMTKIADGEPVYYIDITPQMKESAKKGQPYRKGGTVKDFKLEQELKRYAVGGEIYNTSPDRSDGGRMIIERNGYA